MKIVSTRILAAGNIYSRSAVVRLVLSDETQLPSSIGQLVSVAIPRISKQRAEILDFPAWRTLLRAQSSVPATLVVEALAVLVQRWVNWPVSFTGSERDPKIRDAAAIFETRNADAGLRAGECAVRLLNALNDGKPDRLRETFLKACNSYRKKTARITPAFDTLAIAKCAQGRRIPWSTLLNCKYLRLGYGRNAKVLLGSESTNTSSAAKQLAKRKQVASAMLAAAGLPVALQRTASSFEAALRSARWIGFPVVVKPAQGNLGRSVSVGVSSAIQLAEAFTRAQQVSRRVVIESFIKGDEYRLLVIDGQFFAASWRRPAQVKGDGLRTVRQLVDQENQNSERHDGAHTVLNPIVVDDEVLSYLAEQGLSLDAVPQRDRAVPLRRVSNASQGGDTVDVTDEVHPTIRGLAARAASLLGIDVCGVDFITTDISRPYWETGGSICEVNTRPGLSLHSAVTHGTRRDAADAVVGTLYPDGSPSGIPVIALLREAGDNRVQNAIRAAAAKAGQRVGLASSEGTTASPEDYPVRMLHHLAGVEAITLDPMLDAAIVALTAPEIVRFGLGLDRIDLAIVPAGDRSALTEQACEVLARVADDHVIAADDPRVVDQALEAMSVPKSSERGETAGPTRQSIASAARTPALPTEAPGRSDGSNFTVLLLGDIGFGEAYMHSPRLTPLRRLLAKNGHRYSLVRVMELLNAADLIVGNLEVPLAPTPNPAFHGKKRYLGWSDADETVAALLEAGFDALSLANNHALDCGEAGLRETIRRLDESGIAAFGAGANLPAAGLAFVRTVRIGPVERTIVVFGCFEFRKRYDERFNWYAAAERPGVNPIRPEAIAEQIAALRNTVPAPFFIAYPHWGTDYRDTRQYQRDYARHLIAAGVDLIIGHGAHILQGIEAVAGRPVVYGVGNFVWNTPGRFSRFGAPPYGLAAAVRFRHDSDRVAVSLRLYPLLTDNSLSDFQNRPVSAVEFPEALAALTKNYDRTADDLVLDIDRLGHYVELALETTAASRDRSQLGS